MAIIRNIFTRTGLMMPLYPGFPVHTPARLSPASAWRVATRQFLAFALLFCCAAAMADYKVDIGYTQLLDEPGANMPDGDGVLVTHAEVSNDVTHSYMPDTADTQFSGKTFIDMSGTNPAGSVSGHATSVGKNFYGNSMSISPGISRVSVYNAYTWLSSDYLQLLSSASVPYTEPDRIANHSWVGSLDDATNLEAVKRVDWVVENDEFIQVVGVRNGISTNKPLLTGC